LGNALAHAYLENGDRVYAVGRNLPKMFEHYTNFVFFPYNLQETFLLKNTLKEFISQRSFDIAILNAGILGEIAPLSQTNLETIKEVMEINVWANKEIIDALNEFAFIKQIIAISSGASINGSKGWGAYALSKAALNMLLNVYAKELPDIHFTALAPGVVDTGMVRHIINEINADEFPSVTRLKNNPIQSPKDAAHRLIKAFPSLLEHESGSFLDIRTMALITP